jgi:hypothetical protein
MCRSALPDGDDGMNDRCARSALEQLPRPTMLGCENRANGSLGRLVQAKLHWVTFPRFRTREEQAWITWLDLPFAHR